MKVSKSRENNLKIQEIIREKNETFRNTKNRSENFERS